MTGQHDFDFFIGTWTVHHRRLAERLTGCDRWETFSGTCTMSTIMGGAGNIDDNVLHPAAGTYRAATVRTLDPATGDWSIWWFDGRTPHQLEPPVVGRFRDGVGTFFADDTLRGAPIRVRFLWSDITRTTCRWAQAFSPDGGTTWETNWVMDFERA